MSRRAGEVVVAIHRDQAELGVRRGVIRIDRERFLRRLAGASEAVLTREHAERGLVVEVPRQSFPSRRVARIDLEHLAVKRVRLLHGLDIVLPPELAGLEVERVSLRIGRARLRRFAQQRHL